MAESMDESVVSPSLIGGATALASFGALAYVTVLLFDQLAVALVVGALSGTGTFCIIPYTIRRGMDDYVRDDHQNLARSFHPGAAGYALSSSGIVVLALLFVLESPLVPILAALALAMTEYVILSRVLPRAGEEADEDHEGAWSSDEYDV